MNVLGVNAYHGDSAACLIVDGNLVAAAEEERFNRVKHWAGFPKAAIDYCLREGGLLIDDIDHIAVNRNPRASLLHKALYILRQGPRLSFVRDRIRNALAWLDLRRTFEEEFAGGSIRARIHHVEHHLAHVASSFLVGPFEEAALLSVDGFGDFSSTMLAVGRGANIQCLDRV